MSINLDLQSSYDKVADEYARRIGGELAGKPADRELLADIVRQASPLGPICDLGCGPGHVTRFLHDAGAQTVLGMDLSPAMVAKAKALNSAIEFKVGDMTSLDVPSESWGGIVALYSIIHVPRTRLGKCFQEMIDADRKRKTGQRKNDFGDLIIPVPDSKRDPCFDEGCE